MVDLLPRHSSREASLDEPMPSRMSGSSARRFSGLAGLGPPARLVSPVGLVPQAIPPAGVRVSFRSHKPNSPIHCDANMPIERDLFARNY